MGFRPLAPQVQAAIRSLAAAAFAGSQAVTVSLGYPAGGLAEESIWVSGEFDSEAVRQTSGGMSRSETGTVVVRLTITHTDVELAAVAARAWEVENVLEDAIIADPTLGGLVDEARIRRLKGNEAIPDERTRQYGIEASVTYSGTITAL